MSDVLMLNASYEPLARISWKRAITLWLDEKVEIVHEYEDRWIHTVTLKIKMPAVIRLFAYVRRRRGVRFNRSNVYLRDGGRCQYCGDVVSRAQATWDHVVPRAQGGMSRWENVVVCCQMDNQRKSNRTPEQAGMKLLSKPVRPKTLSGACELTFSIPKDAPASWLDYLRSYGYWHGELQDGK